MSYRLLFNFLVRFIFSEIITLIDVLDLILKLKNRFTIVDAWRSLRKPTSQTSLLTFWSLYLILFHLLHCWSSLSIFKLVSYFFPKLSETCTCERIVVFLFVGRVFQEILELNVQIIIFINNWKLRSWMVNGVSTKLIVENVEIVKVVLSFLVWIFLNWIIINHFNNISLNTITLFFYFPFTAGTSVFVFRFCAFLFSHEFWEL